MGCGFYFEGVSVLTRDLGCSYKVDWEVTGVPKRYAVQTVWSGSGNQRSIMRDSRVSNQRGWSRER